MAAPRRPTPKPGSELKPARSTSGARRRQTLTFSSPRPLVLVAETHESTARALAAATEALGYVAVVVTGGEDALAQAEVLEPTVLVCAEDLPGLRDLEVRHRVIHALGARTSVLIIGAQSRRGVLGRDDLAGLAEAIDQAVRRHDPETT